MKRRFLVLSVLLILCLTGCTTDRPFSNIGTETFNMQIDTTE